MPAANSSEGRSGRFSWRRCYRCHSAAAKKVGGGLLLDSRESLLKGGDSGPAVESGKPDDSLLIAAVRHGDGVAPMPPKRSCPRR